MQLRSFRNLTLALLAPLVGAAMLAVPSQARADLQLSWNQSTTLIGSSPSDSIITGINASANGYNVSGSAIGTGSGGFGPGVAGMDLSTISITSSGAGTLILVLTENNQAAPTGLGILTTSLTGQFLTGTGTVTLAGYGNDGGPLPGSSALYGYATGQTAPPPPVIGLANVTTGAVGLGGSASASFFGANPYTITEILTVNFTSAGTVTLSSDGKTTFAAPEPATLAMATIALPLLGIGTFLRRRHQAKV